MHFETSYCTYAETGYFSRLVLDYLSGEKALEPFYSFSPDIDGLNKAIHQRSECSVNRKLLVDELKQAYNDLPKTDLVSTNIESLLKEDTFTVCTAHQPNIFTGQLYFIYKILHAIRLSETLNLLHPDKHFVPIYFMGSEDADLKEIGSIQIKGKTLQWHTSQKGAVGRMLVDEGLIDMISHIDESCANEPFVTEVVTLLRNNYTIGKTISECTLHLVNELFGKYGLLVFNPDNSNFKKEFIPVIERELLDGFSHQIVQQTIESFPEKYAVQTQGRSINLFYLKDDIRERIEKKDNGFVVLNTDLFFTEEHMLEELKNHPERFSPNVILRPLFQETCLPNVAFIGGGGELAYWIELKQVFQTAEVFYPVLLLRNSFLLINKETTQLIKELDLSPLQLFLPENELAEWLIRRLTKNTLDINEQQLKLNQVYDELAHLAESIDPTLKNHVNALQHKAGKRLDYLQKKMLRAEKKKYQNLLLKLNDIKSNLFPDESLQERRNNFFEWATRYGLDFVENLHAHSSPLDMTFGVLSEG